MFTFVYMFRNVYTQNGSQVKKMQWQRRSSSNHKQTDNSAQSPHTKKQWLTEAIDHYNAERYEECLKACERIIQLDPRSARAYHGKGLALVSLERYEDALLAYDQAIALASNNPKLYADKGEAIYRLRLNKVFRFSTIEDILKQSTEQAGETVEPFDDPSIISELDEKAFAAYSEAIKLSPKKAILYYLARGQFLNEVAKKREEFYIAQEENMYKLALADFEHVLQIDSNNIRAYIGKADALLGLRRVQETLLTCDQAIHLDPDCVHAYCQKGEALFLLGENEDGLASLEQAIRIDPVYIHAYETKRWILECLERYEDAIAVYDQIILIDPSNLHAYLWKAFIFEIYLERFDNALITYDQAIQVDPTSTQALLGKAHLLFVTKRYEEAVIAYDRINQLLPNDPTRYFEKGEALLRIEHYEEALISFEQVLRLDHEQLIALYKKGEALFGSGLYEEALEIFKQAISYFGQLTVGAITHGYHESPLHITGLMYMSDFYEYPRRLFASLNNSQAALYELEQCYKQAEKALEKNIDKIYHEDFPDDDALDNEETDKYGNPIYRDELGYMLIDITETDDYDPESEIIRALDGQIESNDDEDYEDYDY